MRIAAGIAWDRDKYVCHHRNRGISPRIKTKSEKNHQTGRIPEQ